MTTVAYSGDLPQFYQHDDAVDNEVVKSELESDWESLKNKLTPLTKIISNYSQKIMETFLDATQPANDEESTVPMDIESGFGEQPSEEETLKDRVQNIIYDYATQASEVVVHKVEDLSKQVVGQEISSAPIDHSELQIAGDS